MVFILFAVIKRYAVFVACGIIAMVGFIAVSPRVFDFMEYRLGVPLPYEAVVRLTLIATYVILLAGGLWWVLLRGLRRHLLVWAALAFSFAAFLVVAFGDQTHRLMEEFSWIRYTTSIFLLLAGSLAVVRKNSLWFLFGAAFIYAAADEVFEIHEAFGRYSGATFPLPPNVTDFITVAYAIIGLGVVFLMMKSARRWIVEAPFSVWVMLAGAITYLVSTVFDTVDFFVLERLRALGAFWATHAGSYFVDALYVLWAPRNFLNGLEEVLEQVAAALFFAAVVIALFETRSRAWMDSPVVTKHLSKVKRWGSAVLVFCGVGIAVVVWISGNSKIPLVPGGGETIIASVPQGLFHADDIVYHPAWGVVVANEGRGSIYRWQNDVWQHIPDPEHRIQNPDSVTADDTQIYVSDSTQGIIFGYREKDGWRPLWTPDNGLAHPEALATVGKTLYVLDEGEKTITKLTPGAVAESWRPDHPKWVAPESIAYDTLRDRLYVSDDESGALFAVDFSARSLRELATLPRPEDITVLPDGTLLATDTRAGVIFRVYPDDGRVEKIAQFKRPYRDLQGVAYDGERLYVISADGFGSSSFMPSILWQLWIILA